MVVTEIVVVVGINAKPSVGAAEVFFEQVTPGAFIADNGLKIMARRGRCLLVCHC